MSDQFEKKWRHDWYWYGIVIVAVATVVSFYFGLSSRLDVQAQQIATLNDSMKKQDMILMSLNDIASRIANIEGRLGIPSKISK